MKGSMLSTLLMILAAFSSQARGDGSRASVSVPDHLRAEIEEGWGAVAWGEVFTNDDAWAEGSVAIARCIVTRDANPFLRFFSEEEKRRLFDGTSQSFDRVSRGEEIRSLIVKSLLLGHEVIGQSIVLEAGVIKSKQWEWTDIPKAPPPPDPTPPPPTPPRSSSDTSGSTDIPKAPTLFDNGAAIAHPPAPESVQTRWLMILPEQRHQLYIRLRRLFYMNNIYVYK
jgi:hypothetical protein